MNFIDKLYHWFSSIIQTTNYQFLLIESNKLYQKGKFDEAAKLAKQALSLAKKIWIWEIWENKHPDIILILNQLTLIYISQGKYSKARPLCLRALNLSEQLYNLDQENYAHIILLSKNNLAQLYFSQGQYIKAEPLFKDALELSQILLSENNNTFMSPIFAFTDTSAFIGLLNNLATLYMSQKRYINATPLLLQALELCESRKILFVNHSQTLNNLGLLYQYQQQYDQAEDYYIRSLRLLNNDNPHIMIILSNLALIYKEKGDYDQSEKLLQQSLKLSKEMFGYFSYHSANGLSNLGDLYFAKNMYDDAEIYFKEALEINKTIFNNIHPNIVLNLTNLALIYAITNQPQLSLEKYKQATEIEHNLMSQEFVGSSENDRMRFLDNIRNTQYQLLSLVYQYYYPLEESQEKSEAIQIALDVVLKRKALSNAASAAISSAVYSNRYPQEVRDSFQKWRDTWQQIINLQASLYLPENLPRKDANKNLIKELYQEVEKLEKYLTTQVPEIRLENQLVSRQAIALELPDNSTLIEFVYFTVYNFVNNQWENDRYLAFILPAKQPKQIQMIDLGEADKIDDLINKVRQAVSEINIENMAIRTTNWQPEKIETPNPLVELTQTIFQPLQNHLQGQQLFICPDGGLTLIPLEILPLNQQNQQLIIDQYHINYLTAARDLLRYKYQPDAVASESLVIADPNYDLGAIAPPTLNKDDLDSELSINIDSLKTEIIETLAFDQTKFLLPVPMTKEIAQSVAQKFEVKPLLQNHALKSYVTNGKCPKKLFVATHGFFLAQKNNPKPPLKKGELMTENTRFRIEQIETTENPLMRSGFALAGAKTWLLGGELPKEAGEGVVFAQDVAGFDLWANELIILLVCQTAVGDVTIGEGVKGLRSAFTAAGARVLIMSLWNVPAHVSILLMNRFFDNIDSQKLTYQQALQEAQNYIRNITIKELKDLEIGQNILAELKQSKPNIDWEKQEYPLKHRYFWGAWVCVGREFVST